MDPVTQGVVGAALPQSAHSGKRFFLAGLFGLVGGMAPDLDVLIRSDHDPLLYLEYHRHFTHSLFFVPIGGLICALLLQALVGQRWGLSLFQSFLFCTLGYGTHGLLDAATSYGTMLFWPVSDLRVAWSFISIIDPLFTVPILVLVGLCSWRRRALYARAALAWGLVYLSFGAYQNQRAVEQGREIAAKRGHAVSYVSAKPSFGNLLVWKVIYRTGDHYHVDAVRLGLGEPKVFEGSRIAALDVNRDLPWLDPDSQQARDIERFRFFSMGYLAVSPTDPNRIIDLRYSFLPNRIDGLWSIELNSAAGPDDHVTYLTHRRAGPKERQTLLKMILGKD